MTTSNQQASEIANGLTAAEVEALMKVNTFEAIEGEMIDNLKRKGLVVVGRRQIDVTETGRAVLAAHAYAQTTGAKVTDISVIAKQLKGKHIAALNRIHNGDNNLSQETITDLYNMGLVTQKVDDLTERGFAVVSYLENNTRPTATTESAATGQGVKRRRLGDTLTPEAMADRIKRLEAQLDSLENEHNDMKRAWDKDHTALQTALKEAAERERGLREENTGLQRQIDLLNDDLAECEGSK